MTESDVWKLADDYLNEAIQIGAIEERLLDIEPSQETELSRRLIGLFAEASHTLDRKRTARGTGKRPPPFCATRLQIIPLDAGPFEWH
jgi:hypothetical protein